MPKRKPAKPIKTNRNKVSKGTVNVNPRTTGSRRPRTMGHDSAPAGTRVPRRGRRGGGPKNSY